MLPFLKPKQGMVSGLIIKNRNPDKTEKSEENQEDSSVGLEAAMQELKGHLNAGDYKSAAQCFKNAFQLCEEEPHKEGPHTYDAQNIKAGEEK